MTRPVTDRRRGLSRRALSAVGVAALAAACAAAPKDAAGAGWGAGAQTWSQHLRGTRDIAYGLEPEQLLDLYEQGTWVGEPTYFVKPPESRPTLIFFHGGGMMTRFRSVESWTIPFLERGWNVVSPTYRIGPGTAPAGADDAVCALKWVADHASEYGFDTQRIVVSGASSGGQLALAATMLSLAGEHPCAAGAALPVAAVVNWYGVTDLAALGASEELAAWVGDPAVLESISEAYSPVALAAADSPPVITLHGTVDSIVAFSQAVLLHERLDALGVESELVALEGGNHTGFTDAQTAEAFDAIGAFLEAVLPPSGSTE